MHWYVIVLLEANITTTLKSSAAALTRPTSSVDISHNRILRSRDHSYRLFTGFRYRNRQCLLLRNLFDKPWAGPPNHIAFAADIDLLSVWVFQYNTAAVLSAMREIGLDKLSGLWFTPWSESIVLITAARTKNLTRWTMFRFNIQSVQGTDINIIFNSKLCYKL